MLWSTIGLSETDCCVCLCVSDPILKQQFNRPQFVGSVDAGLFSRFGQTNLDRDGDEGALWDDGQAGSSWNI